LCTSGPTTRATARCCATRLASLVITCCRMWAGGKEGGVLGRLSTPLPPPWSAAAASPRALLLSAGSGCSGSVPWCGRGVPSDKEEMGGMGTARRPAATLSARTYTHSHAARRERLRWLLASAVDRTSQNTSTHRPACVRASTHRPAPMALTSTGTINARTARPAAAAAASRQGRTGGAAAPPRRRRPAAAAAAAPTRTLAVRCDTIYE
jgi:hypothetical protein